jgi:hypothetical protein
MPRRRNRIPNARNRNPLLAISPESITHRIQTRGARGFGFGIPRERKIWGLHVTPDEALAAWYAVRAAMGENVGEHYEYTLQPVYDEPAFDWGIVFAIDPKAFDPQNEGIDPDIQQKIDRTSDAMSYARDEAWEDLEAETGEEPEEDELFDRALDGYYERVGDEWEAYTDFSLDTAFQRSTFRYTDQLLAIDDVEDFRLLYKTLVEDAVPTKDLTDPEHRAVLDLFLSGTEGVQRVFHENVYVEDIVGVYIVDPPPWFAIDISGDAHVVDMIDKLGWITVREEDLFEGTEGLITLRPLWERDPNEWYDGHETLYHGTSLRTARKAFPDLMHRLLPTDPPMPDMDDDW